MTEEQVQERVFDLTLEIVDETLDLAEISAIHPATVFGQVVTGIINAAAFVLATTNISPEGIVNAAELLRQQLLEQVPIYIKAFGDSEKQPPEKVTPSDVALDLTSLV